MDETADTADTADSHLERYAINKPLPHFYAAIRWMFNGLGGAFLICLTLDWLFGLTTLTGRTAYTFFIIAFLIAIFGMAYRTLHIRKEGFQYLVTPVPLWFKLIFRLFIAAYLAVMHMLKLIGIDSGVNLPNPVSALKLHELTGSHARDPNIQKAHEAKIMGTGDPDNPVDRMNNLSPTAAVGDVHFSEDGNMYVKGVPDYQQMDAENSIARKTR